MSISRPIRTRCRLCGEIFGGGYAEEFGNGVCHDCIELLVDASLLRTLARFVRGESTRPSWRLFASTNLSNAAKAIDKAYNNNEPGLPQKPTEFDL